MNASKSVETDELIFRILGQRKWFDIVLNFNTHT